MTSVSRPSKNIQLADKTITDGSVFIIAEMACAHNGDFGKAKELVSVAADANVDAVQLQIFHAPANVVEHHRLRRVLEGIEFKAQQWQELVNDGRKQGLLVFACAYDMPSLELALELGVDGIKFNSADLGNREMLERAATSGVFFTLGTGASRLEEIGEALAAVFQCGGERLVLMHGIQAFPTKIEKAQIRRIGLLKEAFGTLVGYADHTDGDSPFAEQIDLIALGAGACVLEKHFTLDRAAKGIDYQAALNPDQLAVFVRRMREGIVALGSGWPAAFDEDDRRYRQFQKKRIVAARSLSSGALITRSDVDLLRTEDGEGLDASALGLVLGKKLRRNVEKHQLLALEDFE
ncbi:MAG: N-acetylneuraminate synthase family protein [Betaproteobacteria bacterium]|nr:MAG: N-acetylneuraminate synthase family protein [Betaproteobacteria bacterium]